MKILKAMVILSTAADKIMLETDMPCPYVVEFMPGQQPLSLSFDATYDKGVEYVRNNFGIEPEVINTRY
jgi:hypothetical protein